MENKRVKRILHTGDIHANKERLEEVIKCLHFTFETAALREVDVIVISGDLWDGAVANVEGSPFFPVVREFALISDIPIVMIYGTRTHDVPGSLEVFRYIGGIYVSHAPSLIEDISGFSFITLSYSRSMSSATKDMIMNHLIDLSSKANPNNYRIFVGHLGLKDIAEANWSDIRMPDFITNDLIQLGCHYYAMGHIHDGEIKQLTGNIRYNGSLYHVDYGDTSPKGFYIVTFENGSFVDAERVHTPSTPIINLQLDKIDNTDIRGMRVKLKIRVDPNDVNAQDEEEIRQRLLKRGAIEVKIERIYMPKNEIRQSLVGAETLSRKVEIWCEVVGRTFAQGVDEKCNLIESNILTERVQDE